MASVVVEAVVSPAFLLRQVGPLGSGGGHVGSFVVELQARAGAVQAQLVVSRAAVQQQGQWAACGSGGHLKNIVASQAIEADCLRFGGEIGSMKA